MPFKVPVDFQKSIAIERWYDEQHKHIQNKEIAVWKTYFRLKELY